MKIYQVTNFDTANGPGLRKVLWVAGCEHHCPGCHNQCTWDYQSGAEPNMTFYTDFIESFDAENLDGITLSGGDPLYEYNRWGISKLLVLFKDRYPDKTVWLYTGYTWEQCLENEFVRCNILPKVDVLVDGRFEIDIKDPTLKYCGSTNQRVIDVQKTLSNRRKKIVLFE